MARRKAYVYIRISRGRMHRRKLEISDQRALCRTFARENGYRIVGEFVEVEYNKGTDALDSRQELEQCINVARKEGAPVLVADLNRLGRNVNFLSVLIQFGVPFIVVTVDFKICPMVLGPLEKCFLKA
ncbi:MAG: recombinase family protein, partial [Rhodospirillales bacterium]|nr:recombinase family protein [Rhodospirillales bacterium]